MFPISDSIKSNKLQVVTISIIALNIYVFIKELMASNLDLFIQKYALIPSLVDFSSLSTLFPFISAMFLHGGFLHIFTNMWFLWIFGDDVESRLGHIPYLILYLFSGLFGNILQYLLSINSPIPMLGASGAVSGVLGAYYIFFPYSKIKSLLFIFFFVTIIDIPAVIWLFYWFFIQVFQGIASFGIATQATGGVAFWAHVGGFLSGVFGAEIIKRSNGKNYIEGEIVK